MYKKGGYVYQLPPIFIKKNKKKRDATLGIKAVLKGTSFLSMKGRGLRGRSWYFETVKSMKRREKISICFASNETQLGKWCCDCKKRRLV